MALRSSWLGPTRASTSASIPSVKMRHEPLGHHPEQDIADGMAQRVVDILNMIEIEVQSAKAGATPARTYNRLI